MDREGHTYGGWSGNLSFGECKAACDEQKACTGIELSPSGKCTIRLLADGLDKDIAPNDALTTFHEGGNSSGWATSTTAPWGSNCYTKPQPGILDQPAQPDAYGSFWRVALYPRGNHEWPWPDDDGIGKQAYLDVGQMEPASITDCGTEDIRSSDFSLWWGTTETRVWAERPRGTLPRWNKVLDFGSWDASLVIASDQCQVAVDVQRLHGKLRKTLHSLWGVRECSGDSFLRLSPELAPLDERGWAQVVADKWYFGVQIFARRLLAARGLHVADETCLRAAVRGLWANLERLPFGSVDEHLAASDCARAA